MDLQQSILNDQTNVSLTLFNKLSTTIAKTSNLVFSPLSINVVLSLLAAGSSGPTRDELLSFLRSDSTDNLNKLFSELVPLIFADGSSLGGPKLSFANGLWVDKSLPLKESFKEVVTGVYKANSEQVDFLHNAGEVASEVNSWAEQQTSGLVKEVLPPGSVDSSTELIFANALYFKGIWDEKFDPSNTAEDDFHLLSGTTVKVPFMSSDKKQFVQAYPGFKVLRIPYKQGEDTRSYSMCFFLPGETDGLSTLLEKLTTPSDFLNQHIPLIKGPVGDLKLPKFKISFGFEASDVLKDLGVQLAFLGGGLTEIVDSPDALNLRVSSIHHKAFIEVNEKGTEAAAATAALVQKSFSLAPKIDFVADHPFAFVVREDNSGVVLFVGHIMNPLES